MSAVTSDTRAEWSARLIQALIDGGYATGTDLAPLAAESEVTGQSLGAILIERQVATPAVVVGALAQLAELPAVDLLSAAPESHVFALIPEAVGLEYNAVALKLDGNQLVVAFAEPPSRETVDAISGLVGYRVVPMLADPTVIARVVSSGPVRVEEDSRKAERNDGAPAIPTMAVGRDMPLHIDDLLRYAVSVGASDLHLTAGMPACIRLNGAIREVEGCPNLSNEAIREMVFGILPASQRERFEADLELDTSHSIAGVGRFRMNVSMQRGTVAVAMRPIPHEIPRFESLDIPESIRAFTELRRGLVLVTGPTGSGKSTTLASLVDIINRSKPLHIVTIEDPIEFTFKDDKCIINQREVGIDVIDWNTALKHAVRQDPDIILVGEMRDRETFNAAMHAAETGHLVFGTIHASSAPSTISRILDLFPKDMHSAMRQNLAFNLKGIVAQKLLPTTKDWAASTGQTRVPLVEVMRMNPTVRKLILQEEDIKLAQAIRLGKEEGMVDFTESLRQLVVAEKIERATAFEVAPNPELLRMALKGITLPEQGIL
jgi:twitching motility protein PilT